MTASEPTTGVDDATYDLILVLQQALEDCYRYQHCARDAHDLGDAELADFFTELATSDREISARAARLLSARLTVGSATTLATPDPAGEDDGSTGAPAAEPGDLTVAGTGVSTDALAPERSRD